jgi:hypothetical protein
VGCGKSASYLAAPRNIYDIPLSDQYKSHFGDLEMKSILQLSRNHSRVVVMEASDGNGIIQEDPVICNIQHTSREAQAFSNRMPAGNIKGGVNR